MVFRAIFKRSTVYLYNCDLPLTADNLVTVLEAIRPGLLSAVPYALKLLSEKEGGMKILKACKTVIFSGSMCPDDLGYRLVSNGVNLVGQLGTYVLNYFTPVVFFWSEIAHNDPEPKQDQSCRQLGLLETTLGTIIGHYRL